MLSRNLFLLEVGTKCVEESAIFRDTIHWEGSPLQSPIELQGPTGCCDAPVVIFHFIAFMFHPPCRYRTQSRALCLILSCSADCSVNLPCIEKLLFVKMASVTEQVYGHIQMSQQAMVGLKCNLLSKLLYDLGSFIG